jgi:hypothetical protein
MLMDYEVRTQACCVFASMIGSKMWIRGCFNDRKAKEILKQGTILNVVDGGCRHIQMSRR